MRRAAAVLALGALVFPSLAFAHAALVGESPSFNAQTSRAPRSVSLRFDERVDLLPNAIAVLDRRGVDLALPTQVRGRTIFAPVSHLPRGPYTVRWKALSDDGHVVSGVYTFGVGVPAPVVTDAVGAGGPTTSEHIVRWMYFVGLALLVGGMGFQLLVVRRPPSGRFYAVAGAGAVVVLETGIVAFLLRAEDALQLPFRSFLYGDLSPISGGTRFGQAFIAMELGFALVTALLFLAWLTDRYKRLLWPAFVLGLAFASGLSLSGHSSSGSGAELADWLHLCAAVLWVGGLVQLVAVVWPTAPELRRIAFRRFSRLATVCVAVLVGAGTYLSIQRLPQLRDLWQTGYGHVLLVKLGLVSLALVWGAAHQFVALPRITHDGVATRIGRSMLGESAVAMAVLLTAAVLVDSRPPARPAPQAPTANAVAQVSSTHPLDRPAGLRYAGAGTSARPAATRARSASAPGSSKALRR
jgi:copper transport protein